MARGSRGLFGLIAFLGLAGAGAGAAAVPSVSAPDPRDDRGPHNRPGTEKIDLPVALGVNPRGSSHPTRGANPKYLRTKRRASGTVRRRRAQHRCQRRGVRNNK